MCDGDLLRLLMREGRVTRVIHLAAQAGVRYSLKKPLEYVQANVRCFVTMLEAVKDVDKHLPITYASSSSVYGLNVQIPFSETHRIESQASLYGATKESNERIAHVYHHLHGLRLTGLRFFTVYGPIGRPDMAYFSFTQDILKHVNDIAERYILPGETAESALMFLPSEAVYAELHANFPATVEQSYRQRVWIVSPTTLMATLNTVRAVLQDAQMREQAGVVQREVQALLKDVLRLDDRVSKLHRHFDQASEDMRQIRISTDKVVKRGENIENIQVGEIEADDNSLDSRMHQLPSRNQGVG